MRKKLKQIPRLTSDAQAERFIMNANLAEYDLSGFKKTNFEFEAKSRTVSLRMPERLYAVVQKKASAQGIKTQRFIRQALERALN